MISTADQRNHSRHPIPNHSSLTTHHKHPPPIAASSHPRGKFGGGGTCRSVGRCACPCPPPVLCPLLLLSNLGSIFNFWIEKTKFVGRAKPRPKTLTLIIKYSAPITIIIQVKSDRCSRLLGSESGNQCSLITFAV
ncbi:hypothetical protein niasHT_032505 [Heterodera trifolii]|uniref:Uncharacterized protein n=1 Tax=Heterodera trifolii TaxID=157864 RepID=A0ABD2IK35_9BILA